MNEKLEIILNGLYVLGKDAHRYSISTDNMDKFLAICPDNQELRSRLKELEDMRMIKVIYASGKILEILLYQKTIDYFE